jgi:5-hydroxyisourate hydrolase
MGISTHILDTSRGKPAAHVAVVLESMEGPDWKSIAKGTTDDDGRIKPLLETIPSPGTYRIRFEVGPYFEAQGFECFYESVSVEFVVKSETEHYHVPLLVNPFGYTTYRGS